MYRVTVRVLDDNENVIYTAETMPVRGGTMVADVVSMLYPTSETCPRPHYWTRITKHVGTAREYIIEPVSCEDEEMVALAEGDNIVEIHLFGNCPLPPSKPAAH